MATEISINEVIVKLCSHFLELYVNPRNSLVTDYKLDSSRHRILKGIVYQNLFVTLHAPYMRLAKSNFLDDGTEDISVCLSKFAAKFYQCNSRASAKKLEGLTKKLKLLKDVGVDKVLHLLVLLASVGPKGNDSEILEFKESISCKLSLFQFDDKVFQGMDSCCIRSFGFQRERFALNVDHPFKATLNMFPTLVSQFSPEVSVDEGFSELPDFSKFTQIPAVVFTEENTKSVDLLDAAQLHDTDIHYTWEGSRDHQQVNLYLTEANSNAFDAIDNIRLALSREIYDKCDDIKVVSEQQIYEDSLNVLVGVPSNTYKFDLVTCSFTPVTDIRYSGVSAESLHGAMEKFAIIGTCFSRLNNFCLHHTDTPFSGLSGGLVMKAFINGIKEVLFSYWSAVFMTEGVEKLSLTDLWHLFEKLGRQLKFLSDICLCTDAYEGILVDLTKPKFPLGASLLSYLYSLNIQNSSTENSRLLLYLFKTAATPYIRFVSNWLFDGICTDTYNEFFVSLDQHYLHFRDKHFWTQGFQMNESKNAVPLFLDNLAEDIFSCGKAINLMKLVNIKHYLFDKSIQAPHLTITFSSARLNAIGSNCKKYADNVWQCEMKYLKEQERKKLEEHLVFKERLLKERNTINEAMQHIENIESRVKESIKNKKKKEFDDLKSQFQEAVKKRKEMKRKQREDDMFWLSKIKEHEQKQDEIFKVARDEVISLYQHLSRLAEKRERHARWIIERHELSKQRQRFLAKDQEIIESIMNKHLETVDVRDENSKLNGNGGNLGKSIITSLDEAVNNTSTTVNMSPCSKTDSSNIHTVNLENTNQRDISIDKDLKREEILTRKNILHTTNSYNDQNIVPKNDLLSFCSTEGSEAKSLLYPGNNLQQDQICHVSSRGRKEHNMGNYVKNLNYPLVNKETKKTNKDNKNQNLFNSNKRSDYDGEKTKNLLYPEDQEKRSLGEMKGEYTDKICVTRNELPSVQPEKYPLNQTITSEVSKVNAKDLLYPNLSVQSETSNISQEPFERDFTNDFICLESDENLETNLFGKESKFNETKFILDNNYTRTTQRSSGNAFSNVEGFKMKSLLYPDDGPNDGPNSIQKTLIESKQLLTESATTRTEKKIIDKTFWIDSIVEPFQDDFSTMDKAPNPFIIGESHRSISEHFVQHDKDENADIIKELPLETIIKRSLTAPIMAQITLVNDAVVKYFLEDLHIRTHFDAFRKFLLLEDGEFGHSLCSQLFQRVASGMKANEFCNNISLNNIIVEAVGMSLYASSIEYSSQLTFFVKWVPELLNMSDVAVLDFLELRYRIPWPCNIIVTENSITKYNKVFSFLLRLKKAGWCLQAVFKNLKRAEHTRRAASSPQLRQLQLFRHEMQHFVNNLERYVVNQIIHVSWQEFQQALASKVHSLDDLHRCHVNYLNKIIFRSLLSKNAAPVYKLINDIFGMISKFEVRLSSTPWQEDYQTGYVTHPLFSKLKSVHSAFKQCGEFLFSVISKLVRRGYQDHLDDLLLQVNFNSYYTTAVVNK